MRPPFPWTFPPPFPPYPCLLPCPPVLLRPPLLLPRLKSKPAYRRPAASASRPQTSNPGHPFLPVPCPQVLPSWEAPRQGSISFKMRTTEPNGLLMYNSGAVSAQVSGSRDCMLLPRRGWRCVGSLCLALRCGCLARSRAASVALLLRRR